MTMTGTNEHGSAAYWAGAEQGTLVLQRCGNCGKTRHYPRLLCDACYSPGVEPFEALGTGTVHSWTATEHAFDPSLGDDVPYVLVTVDLAEGVRLLGRLVGDERVRIGQPVRVDFHPAGVAGGPGIEHGRIPVVVPDDEHRKG